MSRSDGRDAQTDLVLRWTQISRYCFWHDLAKMAMLGNQGSECTEKTDKTFRTFRRFLTSLQQTTFMAKGEFAHSEHFLHLLQYLLLYSIIVVSYI